MGSRNRAFLGDDEPSPTSRNEDEIPAKHTHTDGAQLTKFVSLFAFQKFYELLFLPMVSGREGVGTESERLCDQEDHCARNA